MKYLKLMLVNLHRDWISYCDKIMSSLLMQLAIVFLLYSELMSMKLENLKLNKKGLKLKKELNRILSLQVSLLAPILTLHQMGESMMGCSAYELD